MVVVVVRSGFTAEFGDGFREDGLTVFVRAALFHVSQVGFVRLVFGRIGRRLLVLARWKAATRAIPDIGWIGVVGKTWA